MNIEEMKIQLQKFADANGVSADINSILDNMSSGDFVEISQAMDNSDNVTIMNIIQRYRARLHESYKNFDAKSLYESNSSIELVKNMGFNELYENYKSFVYGATSDISHLSLQEMQTLVFEDMNSQIKAQAVAGRNSSQQGSIDPAQQLRQTQSELQQNSGNPSYKVTVPGEQGKNSLEQVVGVDIGQNPQQSLVVTKDPTNQNQVQVHNLSDVTPVTEEDEDPVHDEHIDHEQPHTGCEEPDLQSEAERIMNDILSFCAKVQERY